MFYAYMHTMCLGGRYQLCLTLIVPYMQIQEEEVRCQSRRDDDC